ncbi:MAG: META domain-containing protein [Pyrinomonadaceae bacterium]
MKTNLIGVMLAITALILPTFSSLAGPQNSSELAGTSWKLIRLQAADETTLVPGDGWKYTITFGNDGRVSARVDCNRGSSTWRSTRANQLQFGSWSMTRAKCSAGSLHDRIVREGAAVRSYYIKDGHLFLGGMAGGGSYELEPLTAPRRRP